MSDNQLKITLSKRAQKRIAASAGNFAVAIEHDDRLSARAKKRLIASTHKIIAETCPEIEAAPIHIKPDKAR